MLGGNLGHWCQFSLLVISGEGIPGLGLYSSQCLMGLVSKADPMSEEVVLTPTEETMLPHEYLYC